MRKSKLDMTWEKCIAMWRWIRQQKKAGSIVDVGSLKYEWLKRNDPDADLYLNCYFCEYTFPKNMKEITDCINCPGHLVDKSFYCNNREYDYNEFPIKFANKLDALYRKYKQQKQNRKRTRK